MKSIRFAEWISLLLSIVVILAIAGYLVRGITREGDEFVKISVEILRDQSRKNDGGNILPVAIRNESNRPTKNVKLRAVNTEIELDYLPAQGTEKVFFILTDGELKDFKLTPVSYEVEK